MDPRQQALAAVEMCRSLEEAQMLMVLQARAAKTDDKARFYLAVLDALTVGKELN